jgi:prevent-host-death family protein
MTTWQLQEAKNKLSKVVDNAVHEGPQVITRHGEEVVVVLSVAEYHKLVAARPTLVEFFRDSPLAGEDLDLTRDRSPVRDAGKL